MEMYYFHSLFVYYTIKTLALIYCSKYFNTIMNTVYYWQQQWVYYCFLHQVLYELEKSDHDTSRRFPSQVCSIFEDHLK